MNVEYLFDFAELSRRLGIWAFQNAPSCLKSANLSKSAKKYIWTRGHRWKYPWHTELSFTQVPGLIQAAEERLQDIKVPSSWI